MDGEEQLQGARVAVGGRQVEWRVVVVVPGNEYKVMVLLNILRFVAFYMFKTGFSDIIQQRYFKYHKRNKT